DRGCRRPDGSRRIPARLSVQGQTSEARDGKGRGPPVNTSKAVAKRDYYEVLGVGRESGDQEIKAAYREMAKRYHPDRNPDDPAAEERFKEASEAYSVLSDSQKRSAYDRFGHAGVQGAAGGPQFNPDAFADFSDILGDFFGFGDLFGGGGRRSRSRGQRGDDV